MTVPPAPEGLSVASAKLWHGLGRDMATANGSGGDPAEVDLLLLDQMLRRLDRLAEVRAVLDAEGLTTEGVKGQTRPHPLLAVAAQLERDIDQSVDRLGLSPLRRLIPGGPGGRLIR